MAKRTFRSLLQDVIGAVSACEVPIRSVEYDPASKRIRVEMFDPRPPAPIAAVTASAQEPPAPPAPKFQETKFIPGTDIPDDNSPVDALALAMARPVYDLGEDGNRGQ